MKKRFLVFAGEIYYPKGGWEDYKVSFDLLSDAIMWIEKNVEDIDIEWAHVYDNKEERICYETE